MSISSDSFLNNAKLKNKRPLGKVLKIRDKTLDLTMPNIMGVLNLTDDSFSDGGQYKNLDKAFTRIHQMVEEGATIIDIGAESTRPGANTVSAQKELDRLCPLLERMQQDQFSKNIIVSIDTSKPSVMDEVIKKYNVDMINDVRALRERQVDLDALDVLAKADIPVILMHMQGKPRNMQREPKYDHVVNDILNFLQYRIDVCLKFGLKSKNLIIDPGFGFGKSWFDNASLLKYLSRFQALNCPIAVGLSRKSMIERNGVYNIPTEKRLPGSIALAVMAVERGASIIRCHDVKETKQAVDLAFDILEDGNCVDE